MNLRKLTPEKNSYPGQEDKSAGEVEENGTGMFARVKLIVTPYECLFALASYWFDMQLT